MAEHLQQMRLSAAVEAAHPGGGLSGRVHAAEVGFQDADEAFLVLALADEVLQFVVEGIDLLGGECLRNSGDSVVEQFGYGRVTLKDLSVFHGSVTPLCSVIGT